MNPIISSLSNKHPMSWELINHRLLHPSDSVRKEMCCHQTLDGLTKHFPKKIKSTMYNLLHRKMTTINKGTTVDTSDLQPGEIFHMDFVFYKVTSIQGFTSILTVVYANNRMLWVLPISPKRAPVRII